MDKNEIDDLMKDFDFKPVTKGLGFHHSIGDKKEIKVDMEHHKKALLDELENRSLKIKKDQDISNQKVNMGELSAFYADETQLEVNDLPDLVSKVEKIKTYDASLTTRCFAWAVDALIVFTMLLTTIFAIMIMADMPLEFLNFYMITDDLRYSFIAMYLMYYIFYFSIMDKTNYSTLGKRLFNIKVIGTYKPLNLMASTARALLSVFSVFTLGLFTLLTLHDSFTGTKVVKA